MLSGGDELGRTQHGNNNAYCQDIAAQLDGVGRPGRRSARFCGFVERLRGAPRDRSRCCARGRFSAAAGHGASDVLWLRPGGGEMTDARLERRRSAARSACSSTARRSANSTASGRAHRRRHAADAVQCVGDRPAVSLPDAGRRPGLGGCSNTEPTRIASASACHGGAILRIGGRSAAILSVDVTASGLGRASTPCDLSALSALYRLHRSSTDPTVNPAPTDASRTRSPFFRWPSLRARVGERQRDRARRRVAVLLEVDDDLLGRQAEPLRLPLR